MKDLLSNFIYNLKMYLKYIAKVGFKELFFDVVILVLMAIIAAFAYVPIGLVEDLLRSLIVSFINSNNVAANIYIWIFALIKAVASLLLFIYLFNNRYDFKNEKVVPIEGTVTLERKDEIDLSPKDDKKIKKNNDSKLDLPKEKEK